MATGELTLNEAELLLLKGNHCKPGCDLSLSYHISDELAHLPHFTEEETEV